MSTPVITSQGSTPPATTTSKPTTTAQMDKTMFLQLLVAQLKNQDPTNPTDSMQFVQQLAQFQQMEQSANMGQDVTAIRQDIDQFVGDTNSQT